MEIKTRQVGDVTILDCSGKVNLGQGTIALRSAVREQLKKGRNNIILNLAEINYIDSSGIGELVSCLTAVSDEGGRIVFLNAIPKIEELLEITKLKCCFTIYDDEQTAIASF